MKNPCLRLALLACLAFPLPSLAQSCKEFKSSWPLQKQLDPNINFNSRSDSADIISYHIDMDLTDVANKQLQAYCDIEFIPLVASEQFRLDLKALEVDSVLDLKNNSSLSFAQAGEALSISIDTTLMVIGDTQLIRVYYGGSPVEDPSGFGGFYFENGYAYNLGVAFSDNPHNYGRVWHPCFDNFVERAKYSFAIKTANGYTALCNGALKQTEVVGGDTLISHWELEESIPTYLASIAAANYATIEDSIFSLGEWVPIALSAKPGDTANLRASFVNLKPTFEAFVDAFGPYRWNKVGYQTTTVGAMEHPTAVSYPISIVNGNTQYEGIMAHELAHHWFGNLITCRTAEDMWINEGFAEFCSHLFLESVYDRATYLDAVEANHFDVLSSAHKQEGGYLAVSGIGHENTYGKHVYNKGASMAHVLRTYLAEDFEPVFTALMDSFAHQDISSEDMRDFIVRQGHPRAEDFFADWIFTGGFPHIELDSFRLEDENNNIYRFYFEVKSLGNNHSYAALPTAIRVYMIDGSWADFSFWGQGPNFDNAFSLPVAPAFVVVNPENQICQAVLENQHLITATGIQSFSDAGLSVTVNALGGDSALLRIEQHLVAPDPMQNNPNNFRLSQGRYWSVDGFIPNGFEATTTLFYDSRGDFPPDGNVAAFDEDSLVLMYRADASQEWTEYWDYEKNVMGSSTNAFGRVRINQLRKGQYTFAAGSSALNIAEEKLIQLDVFPNPASHRIEVKGLQEKLPIRIYNAMGQIVWEGTPTNSRTLTIDVQGFQAGSYTLVQGRHHISFQTL